MSIPVMKVDLPNMPDDVIDMWLLPYEHYGWPPTDKRWQNVLRNDLTYLQGLRWQKRLIAVTPQMLSQEDLSIVIGLYQAHVLGQTNQFSMWMPDGFERFSKFCEYLQKHGVFPHPIVLQRRKDDYWILDGYHRLTAYFYLLGKFVTNHPDIPDLTVREDQEIWVAT
jgi:hypothetical protein